MFLSKRPFIGMTMALSGGVLFGYFWVVPLSFIAVFFLFFTLCIYVFDRYKVTRFLFDFFISICLFLLGIVSIEIASGKWKNQQLSQHYQSNSSYIVELNEVGDLKKDWVKCTASIHSIVSDSSVQRINEPLVIFLERPARQLSEGDLLNVTSPIEWITNKGNPGEFDASFYWNSKGYRLLTFAGSKQYAFLQSHSLSYWKKVMNDLHNYFKSALMRHLNGQEEAVALALVLGDKSLLSGETTASFMNTGALHVLAVSGLHVGLIMQILLTLLGQFSRWISRYQALAVVLVIMWIYAFLTGMSPSVLRAVFMFSVLTVGEFLGKPRDNLNVLFFTAFVLIVIQPFTLFDIGFQLSFLAMLGIFLFNSSVRSLFQPKNKIIRWFWDATAIGFAAQLMTTPLSLYYFHQFPNYFLLANTGLMLTSGLILGFGIALFAFSAVPGLGWLIAFILEKLINFSLVFLSWVESLPGAVAKGFHVSIGWLVLVMLISILFFRYFGVRWFRILCYSCVLILFMVLLNKRYARLSMSQLVVLNHNNPVIIWKNKEVISCFYDSNYKQLKKIRSHAQMYVTSNPGKLYFYPLKSRSYKINTEKYLIQVSNQSKRILLTINDSHFVIMKAEENENYSKEVTLAMPWMDCPADHQLKNGAFILPLE